MTVPLVVTEEHNMMHYLPNSHPYTIYSLQLLYIIIDRCNFLISYGVITALNSFKFQNVEFLRLSLCGIVPFICRQASQ